MRTQGVLASARGLGRADHVCWAFDEPDEFAYRAREFLGDGLDAGEKVCFARSGGSGEEVVRRLRARAVDEKALWTGPLDAIAPVGPVVDPAAVAHAMAAWTREALDEGYTGLRWAADVTAMVSSREHLRAWSAFEVLAERFMADEACLERRSGRR